jgi:hypothetical protein
MGAAGVGLDRDGKVGIHLGASSGGGVSRLEVIEGASGRRRRTQAEEVADGSIGGARRRGGAAMFAELVVEGGVAEAPPATEATSRLRLSSKMS